MPSPMDGEIQRVNDEVEIGLFAEAWQAVLNNPSIPNRIHPVNRLTLLLINVGVNGNTINEHSETGRLLAVDATLSATEEGRDA